MSTKLLARLVGVVAAALLVGFVVYAVTRASYRPSGRFPAVAAPSELRTGKLAPSFALPALSGAGRVAFPPGARRPVVLNFFASWCADCRAELRAFAAVSRHAGRVAFIGIDADDPSPTAARRMLLQAGITYGIGADPQGRIADRYLVSALPVTFFIAASGRVTGELFGAATRAELRSGLARLAVGPA